MRRERDHEGCEMTDPTEPTPTVSDTTTGTTRRASSQSTPPGWGPGWSHERRRDNGAVFLGVVLLLIGAYFLLRDTLHIRLPSFGELWPVLLIALGLWIVLSAVRRSDRF
jgi:hypothetical protein